MALMCHWTGELSLNDYVRGHKAFIRYRALPPNIGNIRGILGFFRQRRWFPSSTNVAAGS